jgi:hypothetical protein
MAHKQIDDRRSGGNSDSPDRRAFSLALVTFTLVFAVGFLITNWLSFVPAN